MTTVAFLGCEQFASLELVRSPSHLGPLLCLLCRQARRRDGYQRGATGCLLEQMASSNVGHRSRRHVASTHDASQSMCSAAMGCMARWDGWTSKDGKGGIATMQLGPTGLRVGAGFPPVPPGSPVLDWVTGVTGLLPLTILEGRLYGARGPRGCRQGEGRGAERMASGRAAPEGRRGKPLVGLVAA